MALSLPSLSLQEVGVFDVLKPQGQLFVREKQIVHSQLVAEPLFARPLCWSALLGVFGF
jgi:hypothetical protein